MLNIELINGITIIKLTDTQKLNVLIAEEFRKDLHDILESDVSKIVINFEGVKFIDSTGFAAIISSYKLAKEKQLQFKLCCLGPEVMELLEVTKLDSILEICENQEECIRLLS